ncbi:MAG: hypothetical protein AB2L14_19885 [Candidatus Xenobiia bacterium LiM19]
MDHLEGRPEGAPAVQDDDYGYLIIDDVRLKKGDEASRDRIWRAAPLF